MNIFSVVAVGIIGALLSVSLKSHRPEYALITAAATGVFVMLLIAENMLSSFEKISSIIETAGIDQKYFKAVFKVIGISYITQFGVEICRDAGESAIASKLDAAGKISIMLAALPIIGDFLNTIIKILEVI